MEQWVLTVCVPLNAMESATTTLTMTEKKSSLSAHSKFTQKVSKPENVTLKRINRTGKQHKEPVCRKDYLPIIPKRSVKNTGFEMIICFRILRTHRRLFFSA